MAAKKRPTRRPQHKPSSASRVSQPLTSDALVYTEYEITDEPLDNRAIKKLPAQVQARIDDLYELAQHHPTQAIPELERLVTTYPHIPTFFNHLSIAYLAAGDQEQATACVREAYRRHPQYLFARVNYANLCLQQGEAATPKFEVKRHGASSPSNDCMPVPPCSYSASNFAGAASRYKGCITICIGIGPRAHWF